MAGMVEHLLLWVIKTSGLMLHLQDCSTSRTRKNSWGRRYPNHIPYAAFKLSGLGSDRGCYVNLLKPYIEQAKNLETRIKKKGGAGLVGQNKNLIDEIWVSRPERPNNPVMVLPVMYAGQSFEEKIAAVRKELEKKKSPGFVVNMLDEIAWLYNLRGGEYVDIGCFGLIL
jgi:hypothetical protein